MKETDKTNWVLLLNPHAGGSKGKRDLPEIEKLLRDHNFSYSLLTSKYPKHAIQLTKKAIESGTKNIIIAGGDGTLNEVTNGIFQQKRYTPEEITLGMIPVGTGNDWIKTFGIPNNYEGAILKIKQRQTLRQDIGKLTFYEDEKEQTRYFSNMAGFGFDALVAYKANQMKENGRSGIMVYLQSLVAAYLQYQTRKVKISIDGNTLENQIFSASVAIGKYNGGGMMQAPNAIPNNGIFEVTIINKIGVWGILSNLAGLYNGTYIKDKRVSSYRAKAISISSDNPLPGEVDGESLGKSQFHIEILPKKLQIIVGNIP